MDKNMLIKALEKNEDTQLISYTLEKLREETEEIIKELNLQSDANEIILSKLQNYRYIDEINTIREGRYIRWINLNDPTNIFLNKGAILCSIKFTDTGVNFLCKTGYRNNCLTLKFDENLIFMKLSDEEIVLLQALQFLDE